MNRLVDSSYDGRKESFTYDKVGNRLTKTTNDITEKYVYNVKNQLKEIQGKGTKTIFTLDKQGNTLKEETNTGVNSFEYNTLNQQVKAITKEGSILVNRYDSEGLRYEIEENDKLSKFIFNKNGDTLVELDESNEAISRFTRGYDLVAADVDSERYYYSVDEQGSTIFITDSNEQVKNEYWYDAFGNVLNSKEEVHNRITYTGQQFDKVTQQYYLRARFYNPLLSRFTQEDEYRGDGLNLYAYCGNNPVGYYDPSGYDGQRVCPTSKESSYVDQQKKEYNEKVLDKVKVQGVYPTYKQNSTILEAELRAAGVDEALYDSATHHIVVATEKRAKPARNILDEVGIEYNSATNAVELPRKGFDTNPYITTQSPHTGRHKRDAVEATNDILIKARLKRLFETGRDPNFDKLSPTNLGDVKAIADALHKVRCDLLDGKIILNDRK